MEHDYGALHIVYIRKFYAFVSAWFQFIPVILIWLFLFLPFSGNGQCQAKFSFTPDSACSGTAVSFQNQSTGLGLKYKWNFGDTASGVNDTSTKENPAHVFSASGSGVRQYQVKLIVKDTLVCTDSITKTVVVRPHPKSNFTVQKDTICGKDTLAFNNLSTGNSLSYQWDFGDTSAPENTDTVKNPQHVYTNPGSGSENHQVTLVSTDTNGCRDTFNKTINVQVKPVTTISTITDSFCSGQKVQFTTNTSGSNHQYSWNFGDTSSGSSNIDSVANPSHVYQNLSDSVQDHPVALLVKSSFGCRDSVNMMIHIKPVPAANYGYTLPSKCQSNKVNFSDSSSGKNLNYSWNFDDPLTSSNTDTNANPTHAFSKVGIYNVRLVVYNDAGCTDTIRKPVKIPGQPVLSFKKDNNCKNVYSKFTSKSSVKVGKLTQWNWDFGDGNTDSGEIVQHKYSNSQKYYVKLTVTSSLGCQASLTDTITVHPQSTANIKDTFICQGKVVGFSSSRQGNIITYLWDYGDGQKEVKNPSPFHLYQQSGNFNPELVITYSDSSTCRYPTDQLTVSAKPVVNFSISSPDTQCFDQNKLCIYDSSKPAKNGVGLASRTVIFGDGSSVNSTPLSIKKICHKYSNKDGGAYTISVEISDSAGCVARKDKKAGIVVTPQWSPQPFADQSDNCFSSQILFKNKTNLDSSYVKNFTWSFGDGKTNTTQWDSVLHTYFRDSLYDVTLSITDRFGCSKSKTLYDYQVIHLNPSVDTTLGCLGSNYFIFEHAPIDGASYRWRFGNGDKLLNYSWTQTYNYRDTGFYPVALEVHTSQCDTIHYFDTIKIAGVKANMGDVFGEFQCTIHDTVIFAGPGYENKSYRFGVNNVERLWDFGDPYAPSCTTDTKNGINVDSNCRYSRDSAVVKHWYTPGKEDCYTATLTLKDTVLGCESKQTHKLALQPPVAGGNNKNASFSHSTPLCLGQAGTGGYVSLSFGNTEPGCKREKFWVIWDSLCAEQQGVLNNQWIEGKGSNRFTFSDPPCDSLGRVTVGLVIKNGEDSLNNACYDTFFYHHAFQFKDLMDPAFHSDFDPAKDRCAPVTITFTPDDTIQDSVTKATWNFDDGTIINKNNLKPVTHTFQKKGQYEVNLTLTGKHGCTGSSEEEINLDFYSGFRLRQNDICKGNSIKFLDSVTYFNGGSHYWADPSRASAGKEIMKWDFGDGNGFSTTGPGPVKKYDTIGIYTIRLAVRDSSGCWDTVVKKDEVKVYGVNADIGITNKSLICAPVVSFKDSSKLVDKGTNFSGHPDDSVVTWKWTFGDGKTPSLLKNPDHNYTSNGKFNIKLKVSNTKGCVDSALDSINIKGPKPKFGIVSASSGCPPFTATLDNKSQDASTFIWLFGDSSNTVLSTRSDTNVQFTYQKGGTYKIFLYGQDSVTDPITNNKKFCTILYPDTNISSPVTVSVHPDPDLAYNYTRECNTRKVSFTGSASVRTGTVSSVKWYFGDGSVDSVLSPVHQYNASGTYQVKMVATTGKGCIDSVVKNVKVPFLPKAKFTYSGQCVNRQVQFTDSSTVNKSGIAFWNWDFGNGKTSGVQHPTMTFTDSLTYTVTLIVKSLDGCRDTLKKQVKIYPEPVASFSVSDICEGDTARFNNTSTVFLNNPSYHWDFGNSKSSAQKDPVLVYSNNGNYTVQLSVNNKKGCADTTNSPINVYDRPSANFSFSNACVDKKVSFNNQSSIGVGSFSNYWDFGDGSGSTSANPDHIYTQDGTYTVKLIITSGKGCKDSLSQNITIYPEPQAGFSIQRKKECQEIPHKFTNKSSVKSGNLNYQWDFGDGNTSVQSDPSHVYQSIDTFKVQLVATTGKGCKDSVSHDAIVFAKPSAAFSVNKVCKGFKTSFTNQSTIQKDSLVQWNWSFGDGKFSGAKDPDHRYNKSGQYQAQLIAVSTKGCKDTIQKQVSVYAKPVAGFTNTTVCEENKTSFTDQSSITTGNIAGWSWDFGDTSFSSQQSPDHLYAYSGKFNVKLIVTSGENCKDTVTQKITVHPKPNARFSFNNVCYPNPVNFKNNSSINGGSIKNYNWDLGDGSSSTVESPVHNYNVGNYAVQLVVTSRQNCKDTLNKSVAVYAKPNAKFGHTRVCRGNNTLFYDSSTVQKGSLKVWNWNFGDGSSSMQRNPKHNYKKSGTYKTTLIVTTGKGCKDTTSNNVIVDPEPEAGFTASTECFGDTTNFADTSVIKGGGRIVTRNWDFGDGNTGSGLFAYHRYNAAGSYNVKLEVISRNNCKDQVTRKVKVDPLPQASFKSDKVCHGLKTAFNNNSYISKGRITRYKWEFGDGKSSSNSDPEHIYPSDGTFNVQLVAISGKGCKDTSTGQALVYPKPKPDFTYKKSCYLYATKFTDQSSVKLGNVKSWKWFFGDGNGSSQQNPSHTYNESGTFKVQLVPVTNRGCKDTIEKQVVVWAKPQPGFTASDTCFGIPNAFEDTSTIKKGNVAKRYWSISNKPVNKRGKKTNYIFSSPGTYPVKLRVESGNGCIDSIQKKVKVYHKPEAKYTATEECFRIATHFTDSSEVTKDSLVKWYWDFDDNGNTSNKQNPVYRFSGEGNFYVSLVVTSGKGCKDSSKKPVRVLPKPRADFYASDTCYPFTTHFEDKTKISSGNIDLWKWDLGDGDSSNKKQFDHTYDPAGKYQVRLIVVSDLACKDTLIRQVPVYPKPDVDFSFREVCFPETMRFWDESSVDPGNIVKRDWYFDDGLVIQGRNPSRKFQKAGQYRVKLIVTTGKGCQDSISKNFEIFPKPVAEYSATEVCEGNETEFTDLSRVQNSRIIKRKWVIEGDSITGVQNPAHIYRKDGTYYPRLIVITEDGCSDTFFRSVIVHPLPESKFTINDPAQCFRSNDFKFKNFTTIPKGSFKSKWFFDRFDSAKGKHASFSFPEPGKFNVLLFNTSDQGCKSIEGKEVTVFPNPEAHFQVRPPCLGDNTLFLDTSGISKGRIVQWQWFFGDGEKDSGRVVDHLYKTAREFIVQLVVKSSQNCYDTTTRPLRVYGEPETNGIIRTTVVNDTHVMTEWSPVKGENPGKFILKRSPEGKNYDRIIGTYDDQVFSGMDTNVWVDEDYYYYQVDFRDSCGFPYEPHTFGNSIRLKTKVKYKHPRIWWKIYDGWGEGGVDHYEVQLEDRRLDSFITVGRVAGDSTYIIDDESTKDQKFYCYRVVAHKNGNEAIKSISNVSCLPAFLRLWVPNAFSPNNDGYNDEFKVDGTFILDYHIKIFNRWGTLVYESNDIDKPWDGRCFDGPCPRGVYIYVIKARGSIVPDNINGDVFEQYLKKTGSITLFR